MKYPFSLAYKLPLLALLAFFLVSGLRAQNIQPSQHSLAKLYLHHSQLGSAKAGFSPALQNDSSLHLQTHRTGVTTQKENENHFSSSEDSVFKPYSDLLLGLDAGGTAGYFESGNMPAERYHNFALGPSASFSTSFLLSYFVKQEHRRFKFGDIFSGTLQTGYLYSSQREKHASWLTAYRFQLGLTANYAINPQQDIGLNFILLDFSHSQLYQNNSGSAIDLNYRVHRLLLDVAAEATRNRIFGWTQIPTSANTLPHLYFLKASYLLPHHTKAGIQAEWFSNPRFEGMDPSTGLTAKSIFLTRVFYGIYF